MAKVNMYHFPSLNILLSKHSNNKQTVKQMSHLIIVKIDFNYFDWSLKVVLYRDLSAISGSDLRIVIVAFGIDLFVVSNRIESNSTFRIVLSNVTF